MARLTVEDCILKIPNRFDLVLLAAQRARDVAGGATLTVDRDNDKNPVVALREIADASIDLDNLRQELVMGLQKQVEQEEPEEDTLELLAADQAVPGVAADASEDGADIADGAEDDGSAEAPAADGEDPDA